MVKKKKSKKRKITAYRSSISGKFVTKKYAKQKPRVTEKQTFKTDK